MVTRPEATIVTCWSLIVSGIFTIGILNDWRLSPPKIGAAAIATTKTAATRHRLQKLEIARPIAPLCTIFVSPVFTALPVFVDESVAARVAQFSGVSTKQRQ